MKSSRAFDLIMYVLIGYLLVNEYRSHGWVGILLTITIGMLVMVLFELVVFRLWLRQGRGKQK